MKFYITTSIAYTNAGPHIGFALESIQADVLARYHRILGDDVFFLTGTDEHGIKVVKAAEKEGKTPTEFIDEISAKFRDLKRILNLSNDYFLRTTDKNRHWPIVREAWSKIKEKGDIYKKKYKGLYCVGCEAFIMKKDLVDGKCVVHQKEPEIIEEENYFFRLSKYQKEISEAIKKDEIIIIPKATKNEMMTFVEQGLEDVSFSRSSKNLTWGIPVPEDESQTIYVWADALINYISGLEKTNFEKYWPIDVHCVGKDITKFHCLIWPGMLFSLGLSLPKKILVHGFINVAGQKMSKSLRNIVDPFELVEKYGTDAVRYFLLREMPPTQDGDFTYEKFEDRYTADLSKGLGNLTARIITLANKLDVKKNDKIENILIKLAIEEAQQECDNSLQQLKFNDSLVAIWKLIGVCDKYIDQTKPWEQSTNQKQVLQDLLSALDYISKLLKPFLPETSEKIFKQVKERKGDILFPQL
ncbi:MAG: methionine--tRNA ligase [Patescibacteria group bacterium]|nr:methionine--tRNA ligase [Patescibacteria group bacterium]MBU1877278.1 methionine--tRNA ligase [Patescibacteria group bacterium]